MAKTVQIKMSRFDRTPWGFRLHGGADYGTPLIVQKVTPASPCESAGLRSGDVIISVNGRDVSHSRHKEAQDTIVRAGNSFQMTIQRGGLIQQTWKPQVTPVGSMPNRPSGSSQTFTKTSLKKGPGEWEKTLNANMAGAASNAEDFTKQFMSDMYGGGQKLTNGSPAPASAPAPAPVPAPAPAPKSYAMPVGQQQSALRPAAPSPSFRTASPSRAPQGFSTVGQPKMAQYNSPHKLYSEANLKSAIDKQSETLESGVRGINFKKNEKNEADLANSAVRRALQEEESGKTSARGVAAMSEFQENRQYQSDSFYGQHQQQQQSQNGSEVQSASFKLLQKALESDKEDQTDHEDIPQQEQLQPQSQQAPPQQNILPSPKLPAGNSAAPGGFRSVAAPVTKPRPEGQTGPPGPPLSTCFSCERLITGVFLKAGGKPMHPECFVCATPTCKGPLKNKGHFHIAGKFYCEKCAPAAKAASMIQSSTQQDQQQVQQQQMQQQQLQHQQVQQQQQEQQHKMRQQQQQQEQPYQPPKPFVQQTPPQLSNQQQQISSSYSNQQQEWSKTLESNKAGAASNAEDFTKQFMSDFFGAGQAPSGPSEAPKPSYQPRQEPQPQSILKTTNQNQFQQPSQQNNIMSNSTSSSSSMQMSSSKTVTTNYGASSSSDEEPSSSHGSAEKVSDLKISDSPRPAALTSTPNTEPNLDLDCSNTQCCVCFSKITEGPFITALGKTWCPNHFTCNQQGCARSLQEVGFVEEKGHLYCEECYGKYLAPDCEKCRRKILGNCLKAMNRTFHPECFVCAYCGKIFANSPFYLEDGLPYCDEDWNELFTTKCVSCGFPIEAGDRWVEALNNNYHSQCFNCTLCKKNLEGQGFFVKAGKPFCKSHARAY